MYILRLFSNVCILYMIKQYVVMVHISLIFFLNDNHIFLLYIFNKIILLKRLKYIYIIYYISNSNFEQTVN